MRRAAQTQLEFVLRPPQPRGRTRSCQQLPLQRITNHRHHLSSYSLSSPSSSLSSTSPSSSWTSQRRRLAYSFQQPRFSLVSNNRPPSATMSTMPASHGHNAACCNVPPIVSKGYQAKGSYEEIGGYKTYVTGPADATKAIVSVYDIFGYFDQTIQGADILAFSDDHQKYKVFMPDWFKGKPVPIDHYPPDTEEKQKALGAFFGSNPPSQVAGFLPDYVNAIKAHSPSVSKFALIGYCWGGKVVPLTIKAPTNPFSAAASLHPAMVDDADAKDVSIPFVLLASEEETQEEIDKFGAALKGPKHIERFGDQLHGWMAARGDLSNERVKGEYERGYKILLQFFGEHF